MNYTENPGMCRVDYFKPSGKWYSTEALDFAPHYDHSPVDALLRAIASRPEPTRFSGMTAVCLEPYTEHQFPVMVQVDDARGVKL